MSTDRRSFLQGVAAVLSAAAIPPVVLAQPSMAALIGEAAPDCAIPVGSILAAMDGPEWPGFIVPDGRTLLASEFPALAATLGIDPDGAVRLKDMRKNNRMLPHGAVGIRMLMRVA